MLRFSVLVLSLACAGCSTAGGSIDGQYSGPNGATLKLDRAGYELCDKSCSRGLMEVRPSSKREGRVTFYGPSIAGYFRDAQHGPGSKLRTWADGVETGYRFGTFGGVSIDIDPAHGTYFKRRG